MSKTRGKPRVIACSGVVGGGIAAAALALLFASGCVPSAAKKKSGQTAGVSAAKSVSAKPAISEREALAAFRLVNEARMRRRLPPLVRRQDLDAVAYAHARDLLRMNKLNHTSSNGNQLENRLARLDWIWAGENLARNKGFEAPAREAVRGWIASPRHFENMFRADFTQTGMAAVFDPNSGFTYFVQVFITPVT